MKTNHETPCAAVPAADIGGFRFYKDQRGIVTARCERYWLGFVVRSENAARMRDLMRDHLSRSHGNR
jgi:hypothetical protein